MCNHKTGPRARQPRFHMHRLPYEIFDLGRCEGEALAVPFPSDTEPWAFLMQRDDYGGMRIRRISKIDGAELKKLPLLSPGTYPKCGTDLGDAAHAFMAGIPDNILRSYTLRMDAEERDAKERQKSARGGKSIRY